MQHKHNAGKNCLSITKFFGLVKAEEKTNATGSVLFMSRAILAPKNEHVDSVNNIIIDKMLGEVNYLGQSRGSMLQKGRFATGST